MSALTSVLKGTGKVLGTGAKVAAKGAGYLGRELLSTIFSSTYKPDAKKNRTAKNKNNKKQKASTELEALNIFNQNVVITNDILEKSLELQKQQNVILSHILGAIKSSRSLFGGDNDGGIDLPDLFDRKKFGQKKPSLTEEERKAEEKAAKEAEEKAAKEAEQKAAREAEEKVAKNAATKEAEEIAAKKAEVTAAKKAGKAVSKGVMERFVVWLEKKGAKALARRIASKLAGMAVGAVIPGLGWLMDVVLIASSVWDAWEAYQLWKEFENSADYKEDDAKKIEKQDETNTAPKDAEPVREEDKKEDGADKGVQRLFASPIIEFEAKDISFTAKDMVINAEDIKSVTSAGTTTGASQTLGANLTGDNIPLTTPNGVPLPGNGEPTKNVPPEVLAQAEQIAATGNIQAVKDFMARNGHPMNGDWCGEFAASVVTAGGGTPPKNPQLASNWLNYGVHSDTAKEGYIAAKTTNRNTGAPLAPGQVGGHVMTVGKYDEKTGTYDIISGNSGGGQLKIKHMSEAQLKAQGYEFRRALTEEEQSVATNKDKPPVQPTKEAIVEPPKKPEKLPVKPEEPKKEAPKQTSNPAPPAPTPPPQPVSAPKQPAKSITPPTEHVSQRSDNRDKTTPTPPPSSQPSTGRTASNESSSAPSGSSNSFADLSMPSTQLLAAYLTHAA